MFLTLYAKKTYHIIDCIYFCVVNLKTMILIMNNMDVFFFSAKTKS